MNIQFADRVKETTITEGTGVISLLGTTEGFNTFIEGIGNNGICYYTISQETETQWEVGVGTVTEGIPDTFTRDLILTSNNNNNIVNFTEGNKNIFITSPAEFFIKNLIAEQETEAYRVYQSSLKIKDQINFLNLRQDTWR